MPCWLCDTGRAWEVDVSDDALDGSQWKTLNSRAPRTQRGRRLPRAARAPPSIIVQLGDRGGRALGWQRSEASRRAFRSSSVPANRLAQLRAVHYGMAFALQLMD